MVAPPPAPPLPSRHVAERRIEQALLSLGATFADCAGLVVYDPDAATSYWAVDGRTGEESIHVGPSVAALEVGCIEMALRHELLHRSTYHGMGEQFSNRGLANLVLDVCINRMLLEAYPDKMRRTSTALYPKESKTTPIALADCTADPLALSPALRPMWQGIWARLPDGRWPRLNPASLYFRLLRLASGDGLGGYEAACVMCGDRRRTGGGLGGGAGRRVSSRAARVLGAIAGDLNKRLPAGSDLAASLGELSVVPTPIGTGPVERFLKQIKIRRIAAETARKLTEPWATRSRLQPFPGYPTRRGLIYSIIGLSDLTRLYWNRETEQQGVRLALGMYMDVSGSMSDKLGVVATFIEALKDFPLRVRSFDTAVRDVDPKDVAAGRLHGGGGTDFDAPVLDLAGDPELAAGVLFTDGEADLTEAAAARLHRSGKRLYVVYLVSGNRTVSCALDNHATESITVSVD
jgi:hypothetical protein